MNSCLTCAFSQAEAEGTALSNTLAKTPGGVVVYKMSLIPDDMIALDHRAQASRTGECVVCGDSYPGDSLVDGACPCCNALEEKGT